MAAAAKKKQAEEFKEKGNKAYGAQDYQTAITWYTKAIEVDDKNHIYYSNRSASYFGLDQFDKAADDGRKCIEVKKDWPKGYFRTGLALMSLRKYDDAIDYFNQGLRVDPNNQDLRVHLEEARGLKASQKKRTNPDGTEMSPAQNAKEDGNEYFKQSKYEFAIQAYTEAIALWTEADGVELKASLFNNRAACNTQLYHHTEVVRDTTEAINLMPNNLKALVRRALAYEALEKYKVALADAEKVLLLDPGSSAAQQCCNRIRNALRKLNQ